MKQKGSTYRGGRAYTSPGDFKISTITTPLKPNITTSLTTTPNSLEEGNNLSEPNPSTTKRSANQATTPLAKIHSLNIKRQTTHGNIKSSALQKIEREHLMLNPSCAKSLLFPSISHPLSQDAIPVAHGEAVYEEEFCSSESDYEHEYVYDVTGGIPTVISPNNLSTLSDSPSSSLADDEQEVIVGNNYFNYNPEFEAFTKDKESSLKPILSISEPDDDLNESNELNSQQQRPQDRKRHV
jgi:hypothetical protein